MPHLYYLIGLFIATLFGWASWTLVITNLSPFVSGYLALTFFYSSLGVALTGTLSLIIYYLQVIFRDRHAPTYLNTSLRQGSLLAIMICTSLIFQRLRVLTWWDASLLLIIILLVEYYFMQSGKKIK